MAKVHLQSQLKGIDVDGEPCEACKRHMHDHLWAVLDENGFVLYCNFKCNREQYTEGARIMLMTQEQYRIYLLGEVPNA